MTPRQGGGLDPWANTTHYRLPGSVQTLCAEPITAAWEPPRSGALVAPPVNCAQCAINLDRGPVHGWFERGCDMDIMIEPWPAGQRRHVAGDNDPARGRYARPEHLQLCLQCFRLRGVAFSFDNLCACDRAAWQGDPVPIAGDLNHDAHLCKSCLSAVVESGTRWSVFYCADCGPAVRLLNRAARRCVLPVGPHSLMNGTSWSSSDGRPPTSAAMIAFYDQLSTLFLNQTALDSFNRARLKNRAEVLRLDGHAVLVERYLAACAAAGFTKPAGFTELVGSLAENVPAAHADALWRQARV
jgi:hypothetical protein